MVFLTKTDGYQKMCDINKNVTKMGMIIKGDIVPMLGKYKKTINVGQISKKKL
jgi:hypothetical protein